MDVGPHHARIGGHGLAAVEERYRQAIYDTDLALALQTVRDALEAGSSPEELVFGVALPALEAMAAAIANGEVVNLAQHFMAAQISSQVVDDLVPQFAQPPEIIGRMVLGSAAGDFHSLGTRIVGGCLRAEMIEVRDLGINVSAERFVDQAVAVGAGVIGISSMMVHTTISEIGCRRVRSLLDDRGLAGQIKIVVGGAPYRHNPELWQVVGADAWAATALEAPAVVRALLNGGDHS